MSGIDPGRPKIEEREASFIAVGTRILIDEGVEWTVSMADSYLFDESKTYLSIWRETGNDVRESWLVLNDDELIRCRVEEVDR